MWKYRDIKGRHTWSQASGKKVLGHVTLHKSRTTLQSLRRGEELSEFIGFFVYVERDETECNRAKESRAKSDHLRAREAISREH